MIRDYYTNRRAVLIVANGYPTQQRPWKCPFNHRAVKAIEAYWKPSVVTMRAWLPWRRAQAFSYDGIVIREVLVPHIPKFSRVWFVNKKVGGFDLKTLINGAFIGSISNQIRKAAGDIDLIHSIAIGPHAFAAQQIAQDIGVPHIVQLIGGDVTSLDISFSQSAFFKKWAEKVSFFIANSKSLQIAFEEKTGLSPQIETVYRGVDPSVYAPYSQKQLFCDSNNCRFLYLGGHIQRAFDREGSDTKGADLLFRAWNLVDKEAFREARLFIGGPMIDARGVRRFAHSLRHPERVTYVGALNANDVPDVIRQVDVLVIPSRREGLPNVCLEAMACGVPVIATAVGGLPEIVQDGVNGLLVPSCDENALAAAMITLLNKPVLKFQLGVKARKDIIEHFDSRNYGLQLSKIYNACGVYLSERSS